MSNESARTASHDALNARISPELASSGIEPETGNAPDNEDALEYAMFHMIYDKLSGLTDQSITTDELTQIGLEMVNDIKENLAVLDQDDEGLLGKLEELGLASDRASLEDLMRASVSEEEIVEATSKENGVQLDDDSYFYACAVMSTLWARWLPDEPNETAFSINVEEGYELLETELPEAIESWDYAWQALKRIARIRNAKGLADLDGLLEDRPLAEWLDDYENTLANLVGKGFVEERFLAELRQERAELFG